MPTNIVTRSFFDGRNTRFSLGQLHAALCACGIEIKDYATGIEHVVGQDWIQKDRGSYRLTEQGLIAYNANRT